MNERNINQLSCEIDLPNGWCIRKYIEDAGNNSCVGIQFHSTNWSMQQAFDEWIERERVKKSQLHPVLGEGCSWTGENWTFWTTDAINFVLINYQVFSSGIENKKLRRHVESKGVSLDTPDALRAL